MRSYLLLIQLTLLAFLSEAQNKLLTIQDALINNRTSLAPENLGQLQFLYGTGDYVYLKKDLWMKGSINGKEHPFLSLLQLNARLRAAGIDTMKAMPAIQFNSSAEWILTTRAGKTAIEPLSGKVRVLVPGKLLSNAILEESQTGYIAYVNNHNLYVTRGSRNIQVTSDGSTNVVYASSVHREEFGITKGTFWSNKGNKLAFYRMDQSMVSDYPIIDWTKKPAAAVNIKYPMAGDRSHEVTLGVYDVDREKLIYLQTGQPAEQYLTNIAWSPDDRFIFIAVLNREQNHMKLNQYDAATGRFLKTVLEEKDDKYVEPLVPMLFLKNKPGQFIWQSKRDGWNHLYLYNTAGKLLKQLTRGKWEVVEVKQFDATGGRLFYVSTEESPITRNLYELDIRRGNHKRITTGYNNHLTQLSSDGKYILDTYSAPDKPRVVKIIETATGKSQLILDAPNPLKEYSLGQVSLFKIKNNTGDSLFCSMRKPVNFNPEKKYPVIVYWYGGTHVQLITNSWNTGAGDYWNQYMAERGYVVFVLDTRGSANRGKAFEQSMFRHAGKVQAEDMLTAVEHLQRLPFVDKNRMGLFGWSFGGFNTINFMLSYPGVFKAAVAGGAVTDWSLYEVMYTERYMDTPRENPEGYAETDLKRKVERLKGKLLLIHGLQDPVVVQQHTVNFVKAAVDKGVQLDYMIYPGHEHNVMGKDRAHLYQKVSDYFNQALGNE